MFAKVLAANACKNIFGLDLVVNKEMKSTSTKKTFLRGIVFNKNVNSIVIRPIQRAMVLVVELEYFRLE